MNSAATFDLRVRFYELDPYGHVNHATYLQYFEAARVAWLEDVGCGLDRLLAEQQQLVVTAVATRFVAPAVLGDQLVIETGLVEKGRVRTQWGQRAHRDGQTIATQRVNFAVTNTAGRPVRIPPVLHDAMASFDVGTDWRVEELPVLAP